ncbi:MAG: squalene/phytoene synthase family protein, partial [Caldimonas sp.]
MSVAHYENFPVASWLCPPELRPPIVAIYRFARTADDIADEGDATPAARVADLAAFRADLDTVAAGAAPSPRWPDVFGPLGDAIALHRLPVALLADLLDAFGADAVQTRYADRAGLLDYCRRSANPIGRLLLHLYGIADASALARSDAICSALQLANFWQDLGVDAGRGRVYVPAADARRHGIAIDQIVALRDSA